jgi:O-antigen/teichoic acid export membrane protein
LKSVLLSDAKLNPATAAPPPSLGASARASLLWGGGFTLLRDIAQFGVMLVLVRLLTPADYGTAALAQAIFSVVSVISFGTFSGHALQLRNPDDVDWQAHFTSATVINAMLTGLVLLLAFGLSFSQKFHEAALPLAALTLVFLIEIPGALRHRMLEAHHDWKRFRLLVIAGTFLGLCSGLLVAILGGGIWALIVQVPMLGLPAAIDLLFVQRFRPDWTWSWARWRDTFRFGAFRAASSSTTLVRNLAVNSLMVAAFDLATLGVFSRAIGLATIAAGRIGLIASSTLYPVITRAEPGSARSRRIAATFLRGVWWSTIGLATLLAITSHDVVDLIYGARWSSVAPLLPLAVVSVAATGLLAATMSLMMASNHLQVCLTFETAVNLLSFVIALLLVRYGAGRYLQGLVLLNIVAIVTAQLLLVSYRAADAPDILLAIVPGLVASFAGIIAVEVTRSRFGISSISMFRLAIDGAIFVAVFSLALRLLFGRQLDELLSFMPAGGRLRRIFFLQSPSS